MFLQGNTFAPEKACPDGQSRRRRDFHTKGKRRGKKGDLPAAVLKRQPLLRLSPCSVALFFSGLAIRLVFPFLRRKQSVETNRRGKGTCLCRIAQSCSGHCCTVVMFAVLTFHHYLFLETSRADFSVLLLNYGQAATSSVCVCSSGCTSAVGCVFSASAVSSGFVCRSFANKCRY